MKTTIEGDLTSFFFPPAGMPGIGYAIFTFTKESRVTLIDPAFPQMVDSILSSGNFAPNEPADVVISHFHEDHFSGLDRLGQGTLWRSPLKADPPVHLARWRVPPVRFGESYDIGGNAVRFLEGRGHSPCGMLSVFNDEYVHVNDLLAFDSKGAPLIPIALDSIPEYLASLNRIIALDLKLLVPHSPANDQKAFRRQLGISKAYLEGLLERGEAFNLEAFQGKSGVRFAMPNLHADNLKRL